MPAGDAGLERQTLSEQVRQRLAAAHLRIDDVLSDRDAAPFHEILDNTQQLTDLIDRLCAQIAAQQAVVDAARHVANSNSPIPGAPELSHIGTALIQELQAALRALDKAQAAQPEGEQAR